MCPECFNTVPRRFRAEYDAVATYAADGEVWFEDSEGTGGYWRALEAIAAGESPEAEPAKWETITSLRRFVAFDQAGETEFEACVGVWDRDPESDKGAMKVPYSITRDGVLIAPGSCVDQVWLKVRLKCPDFHGVIYNAEAVYDAGEIVYFDELGDAYKALMESAAGETPEDEPEDWELVPFPKIFAIAVKAGALADWQRSDGEGSAVKTRDSEERFTELLDDQVWQLTKMQGQTGRFEVASSE